MSNIILTATSFTTLNPTLQWTVKNIPTPLVASVRLEQIRRMPTYFDTPQQQAAATQWKEAYGGQQILDKLKQGTNSGSITISKTYLPLFLPEYGYYKVRMIVTTIDNKVYYSDEIDVDYALAPRPVSKENELSFLTNTTYGVSPVPSLDATRSGSNIILKWRTPGVILYSQSSAGSVPVPNIGYLKTLGFKISCKVNDVIYTINPTGVNGFTPVTLIPDGATYSYIFDTSSLGAPKNTLYTCSVTVFDRAYRSATSTSAPVFVPQNITNNGRILFDTTSFPPASSILGAYMRAAADIWSTYIYFNPAVVSLIRKIRPNWNGIKVNPIRYYTSDSDGAIFTAPAEYIQMDPYTFTNTLITNPSQISSSPKLNTVSFSMAVNTTKFNTSSTELNTTWLRLFVKCFGHALGVGTFWQKNPLWQSADPSFQPFLDTKYYPLTKQQYEKDNAFRKPNWTRKYLPLRWQEPGRYYYWSDTRNPANVLSNAHPPIVDDVMLYETSATQRITLITIKNLVDMGYFEVKPNTFEPTASVSSLSSLSSLSSYPISSTNIENIYPDTEIIKTFEPVLIAILPPADGSRNNKDIIFSPLAELPIMTLPGPETTPE